MFFLDDAKAALVRIGEQTDDGRLCGHGAANVPQCLPNPGCGGFLPRLVLAQRQVERRAHQGAQFRETDNVGFCQGFNGLRGSHNSALAGQFHAACGQADHDHQVHAGWDQAEDDGCCPPQGVSVFADVDSDIGGQ